MQQGRYKKDGGRPVTRRRFLGRAVAGLVAAAGASWHAPTSVRRAYSQAAASGSLDTVPIAMAVGSVEFLWAVLKGRKIDAKHGINAQVSFLDANAINQGLMIGQYQVGSSQPITAAIANNAGKNFTIFAPSLWNNMAGLVPANSTVTSLKDLAGKRIALLPSLSGVYTSTQIIAAEMGLNFEKAFNIVTGPPPAVTAFLQRGDVDGAVQIEPIVSSMLMTGRYKVFLEANAVWKQMTGENMLLGGIAAEQRWLDANRGIAKRLTDAVVEAGRIIHTDPSVFDEYKSTLNLTTPEQIVFAKQRLPSFYPAEWTDGSVNNVNRIIRRAEELNIIKKVNRDIVVAL